MDYYTTKQIVIQHNNSADVKTVILNLHIPNLLLLYMLR